MRATADPIGFPASMFLNRCTIWRHRDGGKDASGGRVDSPQPYQQLVPCTVQEADVTDYPDLKAIEGMAMVWIGFPTALGLESNDQVELTHRTPTEPINPTLAYMVQGESDECSLGLLYAVYASTVR